MPLRDDTRMVILMSYFTGQLILKLKFKCYSMSYERGQFEASRHPRAVEARG